MSRTASKAGPVRPLKAILIRGKNATPSQAITELYDKEGYLIIGNGIQKLSDLDLSQLEDRIGPHTRIDIHSHGSEEDNIHSMGGTKTKDFLNEIAVYGNNQPLNIHLHACFAGAAAPDAVVLPVGSVLVCHSAKDSFSNSYNSIHTILGSNKDLSVTDPVQDFVRRFAMNVPQTTTVSIKKEDGNIFQHTLRPPRSMLFIPSNIIRYLEYERSEFVTAYNQSFSIKIDPKTLPAITESEAIKWRYGNLRYATINVDIKLVDAITQGDPESMLLTTQMIASAAHTYGYGHILSALLDLPNIDVNVQDKDGRTALMLVIIKNRFIAAQSLLAINGIDVNVKDNDGCTALMHATKRGAIRIVPILLASSEIDVNAKDNEGRTALMYAIQKMGNTTLHYLLDIDNIDINAKDNEGSTALMHAVSKGDTDKVVVLLASDKIDVNAKDNDGCTALMLAVRSGSPDIVTSLLAFGRIDVNLKDNDGCTALMLVQNGKTDMVVRLLAIDSIDANARDNDGCTALMHAVRKGDNDKVAALLASDKIDVNVKDNDGCTALMLAVRNGDTNIVSSLIASDGIDIGAKDNSGENATMMAIRLGHSEIARSIIAQHVASVTQQVTDAIDKAQAFDWQSDGTFTDKTPIIIQDIYRELQVESKAKVKGKMARAIAYFSTPSIEAQEVKDRLKFHLTQALKDNYELAPQMLEKDFVQALTTMTGKGEGAIELDIKSAMEQAVKKNKDRSFTQVGQLRSTHAKQVRLRANRAKASQFGRKR